MFYDLPESARLWLDADRGIYIPQHFIQDIDRNCLSGVDNDTLDILENGPDHEHYWDAWDECLRDCILTEDGKRWTLYQDGDLWIIPEGAEWPDPV